MPRRPGCRSAPRASTGSASSGATEVELAVLRGSAELVNEQGRSYISAGERTFARAGTAPSPAYVFNSASWDAFDRWSEARRDQRLGVLGAIPAGRRAAICADVRRQRQLALRAGVRLRLVPAGRRGMASVSPGRWVSLRPYGWTWIAGDPWGWPTHHYGRWGISAGVVVLDSRPPLGAGLGIVGLGARVCQLVSARLEQSPDLRAQCERLRRPPLRPVVTPGRSCRAHHFNRGLRQRLAGSRRSGSMLGFHGRFVTEQRGPDGHFAVNRSAIPDSIVGALLGVSQHVPGPTGVARRRPSAPIATSRRRPHARHHAQLRKSAGPTAPAPPPAMASRRSHRWDTREPASRTRRDGLAPAIVGSRPRSIAGRTAPAAFAALTARLVS